MVTITYRWAPGHEGELPTRTRWRHDNDPEVQPGAFYLCFARGSKAIYCGCTIDPARRFATHALKPWWPEVKRIEVVWYPDQVNARIAEARVHERGRLKYSKEVPWSRYRSDYVPPPGSLSRSEARARTAAIRRAQAGLGSEDAADR